MKPSQPSTGEAAAPAPAPIDAKPATPTPALIRKIQRAIMDQTSLLRCRRMELCPGRTCECYRQARAAARVALRELGR